MAEEHDQNDEVSAVSRLACLPLFHTTLQVVSAVYSEVKGSNPLLGILCSVAEMGVRSVGKAAASRATPLLERLEPQIAAVNSFACEGLDQLEIRFPILNQSAEEVAVHLKDALYLTLDDLRCSFNNKLDGAVERTAASLEGTRAVLTSQASLLLSSGPGQALVLGFDNVLTRSEELADYYLSLPEEEMWREWSAVSGWQDEEEEGELGVPRRVQSLVLRVSLQVYRGALLLWDQGERLTALLRDYADTLGLSRISALLSQFAQYALTVFVAQVFWLQSLWTLAVSRLAAGAQSLASLRPFTLSLPSGAQAVLSMVMRDLSEMGKILLQLLINTTPLYNLVSSARSRLKEGSYPAEPDPLSQDDLSDSASSRRSSLDSVEAKARITQRESQPCLEGRSQREQETHFSSSLPSSPVNGRRESLKLERLGVPDQDPLLSRSQSSDVLLAPSLQLVNQSQRAFEYLSPGSPPASQPANNAE
ncbi:perilipin-3 isoform X1 [Acipenser ruthenus]|uniref:perilipin-3 isoform X1 n=1 Tax=Acipenser ruthenus TaxID=7906 RepID=UPI002740AF9F|nr:perilipin-3 isoform X1 [Acipenser ruthenus]